VTHQASGSGPAAPAELAALLAAGTEAEREQAWAGFARVYTPTMLRVARSLGGDADSAMDRYTFVLERLREDDCRRLRAYLRPSAGDFTLWLVVVVRRLCLDHHRTRYGRSRESAGPQEKADRGTRRRLVDLVADQTDPSLLAASAGTAPDEQLVRAERMGVLAAALARLSASDRLLLRLRFAEDLSARQITGIMRFPTIFHVYRRLDAVLRDLRVTLGRSGIEPGP
jgi:RNA polymerase sigma factor (sigma-70 family)